VTIRGKLYTAIVVVLAGFALVIGVGVWSMNRVGERFDAVQAAADARALALQLKYDITDFNGWQTAYGYDNGKSRPLYLEAFSRFERNLARARATLRQPREVQVLDSIDAAGRDFSRLDAAAWKALQAGRADEVKRILLGPEIRTFERAAAAAQALAVLEDGRASTQDRAFRRSRTHDLRLLTGASIIAALLVVILLVTAVDLARTAERALAEPEPEETDDPSAPPGAEPPPAGS
jgi:hypothetical protein